MIPFNPLEINSYQQEMNGVIVAIVTNNQDPDGLGRVKVTYPWNKDEGESYWARVITPMAGEDRGIFFLPEIDDEVLVSFELGNIENPIILGSLWNGKDTPIETNDNGENNIQKIKSRGGLEIIFDDTDGNEKLEIKSRGGNKITLDDSSGGEKITMEDKNKNSIELDASTNTLTIKSNMQLSLEANMIDIKADGVLTLKGSIIKIN